MAFSDTEPEVVSPPGLNFLVLGPLQVLGDDGPVAVKGPKLQTVLAVLLAHVNKRVSTERLIDEVWGESPPEAARKAIQSYAARLRKAINVDDEVLRSEPPGYVIELTADQLDSLRFDDLTQQARALMSAQPAEAAGLLRAALELWRGTPFDGLAGDAPSVREEATRLEQLRLAALENRIEADLLSNNTSGLVTELARLTQEHPYWERLWGLSMLALYRTGRQAEALRVFSKLRMTLAQELGLDPSPELTRLEQRILDQDPVLESAHPWAVPVASGKAVRRNPYKGLRAFQAGDAADFFGREELVRRLLERLGSRRPQGVLVALVGPSGGGKSSVVKAGLIPELQSGALSGSENWRIIDIYPSRDPFAQLAMALGTATGEESQALAEHLRREKTIPGSLGTPRPLLLVVDQFEELFTLTTDSETVNGFLDLLTTAVSDSVRVIVTLRADFLDRPLAHRRFAPLLEAGLVVVTPLQDHEIRAAVNEPAASVGVRVEPELVAAITQDVADRPAPLPLLQYALTELFDRRRDDTLTLEAYISAGRIMGALSRRASDLYDEFDAESKEAARQLLLRLVTVTAESEHLRRRVERSELAELPFANGTLDQIAERFGDHRLLTFDRDADTGEPTVEVAHEALIREWPRFKSWIEASREDLNLHRRFNLAANEWTDVGQDPGFLLSGSRLALFQAWATETEIALTATEQQYLDDSVARETAVQRLSVGP